MSKRSDHNQYGDSNNSGAADHSSFCELDVLDDSMLVVSDDEEQLQRQRQILSPNVAIDESMILSDEEDDHHFIFNDNVEEERNVFVDNDHHDIDDVAKKAAATTNTTNKKMWSSRAKKNHANAGNAASSALMVDDKPWRKAPIKSRIPPPVDVQQIAAPSTAPKSPPPSSSQPSPHTKTPTGAGTPSTPASLPTSSTHTSSQNPYDSARRPFLKYIRGLGTGGSNNPVSPRRSQKGAPAEDMAVPRSGTATAPSSSLLAGGGVWSDDNENDVDDHSSISSEMISYSSMDSMESEEDCLSLPLEEYVHHPEADPTFWAQLPYIPNHFVHDDEGEENGANNSNSMPSLLGSPTSNNNGTTAATPGVLNYLDPQLKNVTFGDPSQPNDFHFVLDHRFYLRALVQLLAERDEVGVEDSIHDDKNIIKKGPLKKKYVGLVKVKYLELRKGNLVYFGDGDGEGRKTIHLRSATATCHAVDGVSSTESNDNTDHPNHTSSSTSPTAMVEATAALSAGLTSAVNATTSAASTIAGGTSYTPGFEFHLWVEGKRYAWLANSKSEQKSWVRAINQAMIGDKINDDAWGMTMSTTNAPSIADDPGGTHEESLAAYLALKSKLGGCKTIKDYREKILSLVQHTNTPPDAPALQVPLKLVLDQIPKDVYSHVKKDGKSQQRRLKNSIAEFWSNMGKFDFAINGHIIDRESPFAAERTVGALVRCILDYDRSFAEEAGSDSFAMPSLAETPGQSAREHTPSKRPETDRLSELEAVSYARSILLMILKCKTSPVVEMTVENLCKHEGLVNVEHVDPSSSLSTSSETLHIDVSFAGDDVVDHADDSMLSDEASGWVMVRRSKYNSWKTRFCVFSEGVFSYYENAKPRPHGLRGQLLLNGAYLSDVEDEKDRTREDSGLYILRLATKGQERERQFGFKTQDEYLEWKEAIRHVVDTCNASTSNRDREENAEGAEASDGGRESSSKKPRGIIEGGTKLISYAADGGIKAIKGATGGGIKVVKGGTKVVKGAAGGSVKALRGATNLVFRTIRSSRGGPKRDDMARSLRKSPSLQFLMENTRSDKTGKREPTVQCVIQTTKDFMLCAADHKEGEDELV